MFEKLIIRRLDGKLKSRGYDGFYNATDKVITSFRRFVKGNKELSDLEVLKKLNRNFISSKASSVGSTRVTKYYGYLSITLDLETNTFINVYNDSINNIRGSIDKNKKKELNKLLKIK